MAEYALVEPFECDDIHFAFGVEWEMFRQRLKTGKPFSAICIAENAARLEKMAERQGRFCETGMSGTEGWSRITVGDYFCRE